MNTKENIKTIPLKYHTLGQLRRQTLASDSFWTKNFGNRQITT